MHCAIDARRTSVAPMGSDLEFALELADACDQLTLPLFERRAFAVAIKADTTEVTEVDRAAERLITEAIARERPAHRCYGEEYGSSGPTDSPWQWIVDPIDGTSGFVRGQPVWATLIALEHIEHGVMAAVVSAPALKRRWWAAREMGTFSDGRRCAVSTVSDIAEAQLSVTFNAGWDDLALTDRLVDLQRRARRVRNYGDFWQHCLVAEGAVDIAIDAVGVAAYDLAAVRLIVEEAGGRFTDRHGVATHRHDTAISSNGRLHDEVIHSLGTDAR